MISQKALAVTETIDNWADFRTAVIAPNTDKIVLTQDITAGSALGTVTRNLEIDGQGHQINFVARTLTINAGGIVTLKNAVINGSGTTFNGTNGVLNLTGDISTAASNTAIIANINGANSQVNLDSVNMKHTNSTSTGTSISATNFTITNGSVIESDSISFYESKTNGGITTVDKGSKVNIRSYGTGNNTSGQAFKYNNQADIFIKDEGTEVNISGNVYTDGNNGALFTVQVDDSSINVLDGAKMNLLSERTTALVMYSQRGVFNVKNNSELNFTSHGNNNGYGGTIRFRIRGQNSFNIEDNSKVTILKTGKNNSNQTAKLPPGIRMSGQGNTINVKNNSDFIVVNEGPGSGVNSNPGSDTANQGILYNTGTGNAFTVDGENSNVQITANHGAAIDAKSAGVDITAGQGTYFVTRGATATNTEAIFAAGAMQVAMDTPKYFDFSNTVGQVFENARTSKMSSLNSDLSVWNKGLNIAGNPTKSWTLINYALSGVNFDTIDTADDPTFLSGFGKMSNYGRINANNQSAKINSIRIPTNADKYIYVDVTVPEGKTDVDRAAFVDEVGVKIGLYDEDDKEIDIVHARTGTYSVYGEDEKMGIAKIPIPNNEFIKAGTKVKVLSAWRGSGEENSNKVYMSTPEDITAKEVVAIDVTPPNQVVSGAKLTNATKQVSGTSDKEGAKVFFKLDGQWLSDVNAKPIFSTVTNKKWGLDLSEYVEKDSVLDIYIKDITEITTNVPYDLPTTYAQEPDGTWGNISVNPENYNDYVGYHDAVKTDSGDFRFKPALQLNTADVLPDQPKLTKTFDAPDKDNIQVGDTLTYTINVKNDKEMTYDTDWKKVVVTDSIPEDLLFNKSTAKLTVNDVPIAEADYDYDETTKILKVPVGDLTSQEASIISFKTRLDASAVGKVIINKATAVGDSPRDKVFVIGPENADSEKETYSAEGQVSTDNEVFGTIAISSFPNSIDFGNINYDAKVNQIDNGTYDRDLIVNDTRARKESWTLGAKLVKQMSKVGDDSFQLVDSLQYFNGEDTIVLSPEMKPIYQSSKEDETKETINISDSWGTSKESNGIKLVIDPSKTKLSNGIYEGTIEWQLMESTP